jgi:hypothetical protein
MSAGRIRGPQQPPAPPPPQVAATTAVSNPQGHQTNPDDAQSDSAQAPQQYNGAMFRAARGPITARQQRPQRRQPQQQNNAQAASDEAMTCASTKRTRDVALQIDLSVDAGSQDEPRGDQRQDHTAKHKHNRQLGLKAEDTRFRMPPMQSSGAPSETAALTAADSKSSPAPPQKRSQRLAQALLHTARHFGGAPQQMRAALMAQVRDAIGAAQPAAVAADLKKVRAELIEAARGLGQLAGANAAQSAVLSLLPLVLLGVERTRTPQQAQRALAKLEAMQRNTT